MPQPTSAYSANPRIAPADSLLGQLQRGRGAGFLTALETPPEELWPLLEECILHDPCWDRGWETRVDYFARLVLLSGMPLETLWREVRVQEVAAAERDGTPEALGVLSRLAVLGHSEAVSFLREYCGSGRWWLDALEGLTAGADPAGWRGLDAILVSRLSPDELVEEMWRFELDSPALTDWVALNPAVGKAAERWNQQREARPHRLPDPEEFRGHPLGPLMDAVDPMYLFPTVRLVRSIAGPGDLSFLAGRLATDDPVQQHLAIAGLSAIGSEEAFHPVGSYVDAAGKEPHRRVGAALWRYLDKFPEHVVLPRARNWILRAPSLQADLAVKLLSRFAEAQDAPALMAIVDEVFARDEQRDLYYIASALGRTGVAEVVPCLRMIFRETTYSWTRRDAANALALLNAPGFQSGEAVECLWDSDDAIRMEAVPRVDLDDARVRARLLQIRDDHLEDEDVRAAARARLE